MASEGRVGLPMPRSVCVASSELELDMDLMLEVDLDTAAAAAAAAAEAEAAAAEAAAKAASELVPDSVTVRMPGVAVLQPGEQQKQEQDAAKDASPTFRFLGTGVHIHWSFYASLPLWFFMFMHEWSLTFSEYVWGLSLVLCLGTSLFLHEVGHMLALVACKQGVSSIVLCAIGGVTIPASEAKSQSMFKHHHWLAIFNFAAGPGANFVLAGLALGLRACLLAAGYQEGPLIEFWRGSDVAIWFLYAGFINICIGVYNLLPIFPLDGGHIFYHLFAMCLAKHRARYATTAVTVMMASTVVGIEWFAVQAGDGSLLSLLLVVMVCFGAILMSIVSSYDSYKENKRSTARTVGVGARVPHHILHDVEDVPRFAQPRRQVNSVELPLTTFDIQV